MRRALIGTVIVAVLAWAAWRIIVPPRGSEPTEAVPADSIGAGFQAARLFFASPSGDSLVSESRELMEAQTLHERMAALVSGSIAAPVAAASPRCRPVPPSCTSTSTTAGS